MKDKFNGFFIPLCVVRLFDKMSDEEIEKVKDIYARKGGLTRNA